MSEKRCGKTLYILQEYEKAKADGKKALLVDKEQLEKKLLGAETLFDKLYKKLKGGDGVLLFITYLNYIMVSNQDCDMVILIEELHIKKW